MLLIAIVLVSSILSSASAIGIDGWVSIQGSDPTLRAVDISAKGNQVWIIGSDGALHYWSVSALTPDGDWQWIDETNGQRTTPYPLKHIGATADGCVWTFDQRGNIARYNSSALGWKTITGGPNVTWISAQTCNISSVITNTFSTHYANGNTHFYYQNGAWTQLYTNDWTGGPYPNSGITCAIGDNNEGWLTNSNGNIYSRAPVSTTPAAWTQLSGLAKQIDAENGNLVIIVDFSGNMYLWNGGGWQGIPGGPAVRATINTAQAFYIDASGNAYSTNIV